MHGLVKLSFFSFVKELCDFLLLVRSEIFLTFSLLSSEAHILLNSCFCRLFGFYGGKLTVEERIDLSLSDIDLVPLLIQVDCLNLKFTHLDLSC